MFIRIDYWIDWLAYDGGWTYDLMYSPRLGTFAPMCQFGRSVIRPVLSKLLFDQTPTAQSGNQDVCGPVGQS